MTYGKDLTWRELLRYCRKHGKAVIIAELEGQIRLLEGYAKNWAPGWGLRENALLDADKRRAWIKRLQLMSDVESTTRRTPPTGPEETK